MDGCFAAIYSKDKKISQNLVMWWQFGGKIMKILSQCKKKILFRCFFWFWFEYSCLLFF